MKYTVQDGYPYYIGLVSNADYRQLFSSPENLAVLESIDETRGSFRYAQGKWSTKQVVGHIADHERIMMYRALRFSRKDPTKLPGYDQNLFVENSRFDELSMRQLVSDFRNVRVQATVLLKRFRKNNLN